MEIISKKFDLGSQYNFKDLFNVEGSIKNVYIATAYADSETLRAIFNIVKSRFDGHGAIFSVYLDRSSSQALTGQDLRRKYTRLSTDIRNYIKYNTNRKNIDKCGIFLVNMGRLFHSKAIYIETKENSKLLLGSINMTNMGISKNGNEELFCIKKLNMDEKNRMEEYFEKLYANSLEVHSENEVHHNNVNLRDFFLSGKLYNEIGKNKSIFYFPLDLPDEIDNNQKIHEYIDQDIKNRLNILKICKDKVNKNLNCDEEQISNIQESWKRYCLITDYGYWCPKEYINRVNNILYNKESHQYKIVEQLEYLPTNDFISDVTNIFEEISNNIERNYNIKWEINLKSWETWYARLKERIFIENGKIYEIREEILPFLVSGIYESNVPDLWYSKQIVNDFENSFIDSIQHEHAKVRSNNMLVRSLGSEINSVSDLQRVIREGISFEEE